MQPHSSWWARDESRSLEGTEEQTPKACRLLGGTFADVIQLSLAVMAIGSLVLKRFQETPQRPWCIWSMDVSKQCLGSLAAHFENVILAMLLAIFAGGGDQCAYYFTNYIVDSTLGLLLDVMIIKLLEIWAGRQPVGSWPRLYIAQNGSYGNPPSWRTWWYQTIIWIGVVTGGKVGLLVFLLIYNTQFSYWGSAIFKPLLHYPQVELVVVMVIVPAGINIVQFWVLDTILKSDVAEPATIASPDKDHFKVSYAPIEDSFVGGPIEYACGSGVHAASGAARRGTFRSKRPTSARHRIWYDPLTWLRRPEKRSPAPTPSRLSEPSVSRAALDPNHTYYQPPSFGSEASNGKRRPLEPAWLSMPYDEPLEEPI